MIAADHGEPRRPGETRRCKLIGGRDRKAARRVWSDIRHRERVGDRVALTEQQTAYLAQVGVRLGGETIEQNP